jgi:hypothetical protein
MSTPAPPHQNGANADSHDRQLVVQRLVRSIETAPRDGTEILLWREDAGWFLARWIAPCDFLHERELENMNDTENPDWFYADFICGGRWDGGAPTHWMSLPDAPNQ